MDQFDFNQFQSVIFKEVFSNPFQKAPETKTTFDFKQDFKKEKIVVRSNVQVSAVVDKKEVEAPKKERGRPKRARKRSVIEDGDFIVGNERKVCKLSCNKTENSYAKKYLKSKKANKLSTTIQTTHFERYQKKEEIEKSSSNVRRSLRAKLKKRKSVEVFIEIIEKEFHEIKSQEEFLFFVGLRKVEERT